MSFLIKIGESAIQINMLNTCKNSNLVWQKNFFRFIEKFKKNLCVKTFSIHIYILQF